MESPGSASSGGESPREAVKEAARLADAAREARHEVRALRAEAEELAQSMAEAEADPSREVSPTACTPSRTPVGTPFSRRSPGATPLRTPSRLEGDDLEIWSDMVREVEDTRESLRLAEEEVNRERSEREAVEAALAKEREERASLAAERDACAREAAERSAALSNLEQELVEQSQRARSHSMAAQSDSETIMNLKAQVMQLRRTVSEQRSKNSELRAEINNANRLREEDEDEDVPPGLAKEGWGALQAKLEALTAQCEALERLLDEQTSLTAAAEERCVALQAEKNALQAAAEEAGARAVEAESNERDEKHASLEQRAKLEHALNFEKCLTARLEEELAGAKSGAEAAARSEESLRASLEEELRRCHSYGFEVQSLNETILDLRKELEGRQDTDADERGALAGRCDALQEELACLREEHEVVKKALANSADDVARHATSVERAQAAMETERDRRVAVEERVAVSEAEAAALRDKLEAESRSARAAALEAEQKSHENVEGLKVLNERLQRELESKEDDRVALLRMLEEANARVTKTAAAAPDADAPATSAVSEREYCALLARHIIGTATAAVEAENLVSRRRDEARNYEQIVESLKVSNEAQRAELRDLRQQADRFALLSEAAQTGSHENSQDIILRRLDKAVAALDRERTLTASLQQSLVAERQIIATHEASLAQAGAAAGELEKLLQEGSSTIESLRERESELLEMVARLQDQYALQAEAIDSMRGELDASRGAAERLEGESGALRQRVEEEEQAKANMVRTVDDLLSENVEMMDTVNKLRAEVALLSQRGDDGAAWATAERTWAVPGEDSAGGTPHVGTDSEEVSGDDTGPALEDAESKSAGVQDAPVPLGVGAAFLAAPSPLQVGVGASEDPKMQTVSGGDAASTDEALDHRDVPYDGSYELEDQEDPETDEEQSSSIFSSLYRVGLFGFIAGSDKIDASEIRTSA